MSVVDFSVLNQFCDLLGEDGKQEACELIKLYLDDGPEHIDNMKKSLDNKDADTFRRAAHTFKSSSANVGAFGLQTICQKMENQASQGDMNMLANDLSVAISQFDQVKKELQNWAF